jgi:hypothetical protein
MLDFLSPCQAHFRWDTIRIDSLHFILHYKLTTALFLAACALTSTNQLFGDPIQCTEIDAVSPEVNPVVDVYAYQVFYHICMYIHEGGCTFCCPRLSITTAGSIKHIQSQTRGQASKDNIGPILEWPQVTQKGFFPARTFLTMASS